jgi:hypothetical protein
MGGGGNLDKLPHNLSLASFVLVWNNVAAFWTTTANISYQAISTFWTGMQRN